MAIDLDLVPRIDDAALRNASQDIERQFGRAVDRVHEDMQRTMGAGFDRVSSEARESASDMQQAYDRTWHEFEQSAQQAGDRASRSLSDKFREAASATATQGKESADNFFSGFAGASSLARIGSAGGPVGLAIAAAAALGFEGGKVLADNINAGMESLQTQDLFRARMGVDPETMARFGSAAGEAFVHGYGTSIEDNLRATQFAVQSHLIDTNATQADVTQVTSQMQSLAKVMDEDVQHIAQGSRNFIKTGLVGSTTEAMDLLTAATQRGLDISGDLLDSAEEYGTAFHGVGLSGVDAFGMIQQMQEAGIRNTDVAADSLKELAINVGDGTTQTASAFAAMGLNATDMNQRFAQGGPAARDAFGEVLTGLASLQDPVQRQLVGQELFKTKWEDAKTAIQAANLSGAASELGQVAGASQDAANAVAEHASQWDTLSNNIDVAISKFQQDLADSPLGRFWTQTIPGLLNDNLFDPPAPPPPAPGQPLAGSGLLGDPPGPPVQGPGYAPAPSSSALPPALLGGTSGPALVDPRITAPIPQQPTLPLAPPPPPIQHQAPVPMVPGFDAPGSASKPKLPDAPVLPMEYSSIAGMPAEIANAQTRLDETRHAVATATARVQQLEQSNVATDADNQKARNDLASARRDQQQAEQGLTDQTLRASEKATKQLQGHADALEQIGSKIDDDFGISKGLSGIAENVTKFVGNLIAAPELTRLQAISGANPNQGSGLLGIAASQGAFGAQYTPAGQAAASSGSTSALGAPGAQPVLSASVQGPVQALVGPGGPGTSPNGFTLNAPEQSFAVNGVSSQGAAGGPAARLQQFAQWFNDNIEPVKELAGYDAGGHGLGNRSNHTSGTALDINWGDFTGLQGNGADARTHFNPSQMAAISQQLTAMGMTWGQYWTPDSRDPGHFELGGASYSGKGPQNIDPISGQPTGGPVVPGTAVSPAASLVSASSSPGGSGGGGTAVFVTNWPGGGLPGGPGSGGSGSSAPSDSVASGQGAGPAAGPSGGLSTDQWNKIMGAEAGGSGGWKANTGNGFSGGLQFTPETWKGFGGGAFAPEAWQATPEQQMAVGNKVLAGQGAGAWPATSEAHPDWFAPGSGAAGAGPLPGIIPGSAGQGYLGVQTPGGQAGGQPAKAYGGQAPSVGAGGPGFAGIGGAPLAALQGAAGMIPGAGAAASTAIQLTNRTIGYAGQNVGIAAQGILDSLTPHGSDLASNSWLTRIIGGFAGAKPALPNLAGDKQGGQGQAAPPQQPGQAPPGGQGQQKPGGPTVQIGEMHNHGPDGQGVANDIAVAAYAAGH